MNVLKPPATAGEGREVDRRSVEPPLEASANYKPEAIKDGSPLTGSGLRASVQQGGKPRLKAANDLRKL